MINKLRKLLIKLLSGWFFYHFLSFFRDLYFESRYLRYRKAYDISKSFKFNGVDIEFYGKGQINIGKNSYLGNRSVLASDSECNISIGENCALSHNIRIYTSNRNPNDIIFEKDKITNLKGNVSIGNNVWIGANVFINQGVTIGDNCVIGANTVVTKSIPSNSVVVGTPGRIIKRKEE